MNREFVHYEQALDLKELGFKEPCFAIYNLGLSEFEIANIGQIRLFSSIFRIDDEQSNISYVNDKNSSKVTAPLYQQAFRWFREKYKLSVIVSQFGYAIENEYGQIIYTISEDEYPLCYEEAELECLKKLIEIVKNKK